jgi:hypothetical protein
LQLICTALENSNNKQKMAEAIKTLLKFENETARKRDTNINPNTRVSPEEKQ